MLREGGNGKNVNERKVLLGQIQGGGEDDSAAVIDFTIFGYKANKVMRICIAQGPFLETEKYRVTLKLSK
jgi:hypothetical protein